MNGRAQVAAYSRLVHGEQLAGHRVGDLVDAPTLGRCEVVELLPPSLLRVRTQSGALVKLGWRAAVKAKAAATPTGERAKQAQNRHRTR